jgi:hypothetical protein
MDGGASVIGGGRLGSGGGTGGAWRGANLRGSARNSSLVTRDRKPDRPTLVEPSRLNPGHHRLCRDCGSSRAGRGWRIDRHAGCPPRGVTDDDDLRLPVYSAASRCEGDRSSMSAGPMGARRPGHSSALASLCSLAGGALPSFRVASRNLIATKSGGMRRSRRILPAGTWLGATL